MIFKKRKTEPDEILIARNFIFIWFDYVKRNNVDDFYKNKSPLNTINGSSFYVSI